MIPTQHQIAPKASFRSPMASLSETSSAHEIRAHVASKHTRIRKNAPRPRTRKAWQLGCIVFGQRMEALADPVNSDSLQAQAREAEVSGSPKVVRDARSAVHSDTKAAPDADDLSTTWNLYTANDSPPEQISSGNNSDGPPDLPPDNISAIATGDSEEHIKESQDGSLQFPPVYFQNMDPEHESSNSEPSTEPQRTVIELNHCPNCDCSRCNWCETFQDLRRYRSAVQDSVTSDREIWSSVAGVWYHQSRESSSDVGRLAHHLAVLERPCPSTCFGRVLMATLRDSGTLHSHNLAMCVHTLGETSEGIAIDQSVDADSDSRLCFSCFAREFVEAEDRLVSMVREAVKAVGAHAFSSHFSEVEVPWNKEAVDFPQDILLKQHGSMDDLRAQEELLISDTGLTNFGQLQCPYDSAASSSPSRISSLEVDSKDNNYLSGSKAHSFEDWGDALLSEQKEAEDDLCWNEFFTFRMHLASYEIYDEEHGMRISYSDLKGFGSQSPASSTNRLFITFDFFVHTSAQSRDIGLLCRSQTSIADKQADSQVHEASEWSNVAIDNASDSLAARSKFDDVVTPVNISRDMCSEDDSVTGSMWIRIHENIYGWLMDLLLLLTTIVCLLPDKSFWNHYHFR